MNIRSTTPVLKKAFMGSFVVVVALVLTVTSVVTPVFADQYDDQIKAIQEKISQYQGRAEELSRQSDSLQVAIDNLQIQQNTIQAQVDLSQAKYDKLIQQIKDTEVRIEKNKKALSRTISDLYVNDTVSPVEMLASSQNIGDYLDQQEFRSSIKNKVEVTLKEIKKLKVTLEKDKQDVERVLNDQKAQKKALADKQAEQAALLAQTQGNEAAYQGMIASSNSAVAALRARQAAAYRQYGTGSNSPTGLSITYKNLSVQSCSSSGYSYCGYGWDDIVDDPWGLGYTKECVHYAADTLARRGYYIPYRLFAGRGNAYQWTSTASGVATIDSNPSKDAVVYMPIGGVGHVGIVEQVYGDGWIKVSQMNLPFGGNYSTMDLKLTSNLAFIHFSH